MQPQVLIVMGVAGSGKTTLARALATRLSWDFQEGDELHPPANIAKMTAGHPLTDADRAAWLAAVAAWIDAELASGRHGVISCSALKRRYRDQLRRPAVRFVYLDVPANELVRRLHHRPGHFMPAELLASQLADLEPPEPDELATVVPRSGFDHEVAEVVRGLMQGSAHGTAGPNRERDLDETDDQDDER